jgi:hypothetical protein
MATHKWQATGMSQGKSVVPYRLTPDTTDDDPVTLLHTLVYDNQTAVARTRRDDALLGLAVLAHNVHESAESARTQGNLWDQQHIESVGDVDPVTSLPRPSALCPEPAGAVVIGASPLMAPSSDNKRTRHRLVSFALALPRPSSSHYERRTIIGARCLIDGAPTCCIIARVSTRRISSTRSTPG